MRIPSEAGPANTPDVDSLHFSLITSIYEMITAIEKCYESMTVYSRKSTEKKIHGNKLG